MNKATFAAAGASSIMNQKATASATTITSQIAGVHLSGSNSSSVVNSNGKTNTTYHNGPVKVVSRNGGPGVPPKPPMIYRNALTSATQEPGKGATIQVNQKQSDNSDKSLTDDSSSGSPLPPDCRAKQVLKEAVNAVVNSFAKHSQGGYGRGELSSLSIIPFSSSPFPPLILQYPLCRYLEAITR